PAGLCLAKGRRRRRDHRAGRTERRPRSRWRSGPASVGQSGGQGESDCSAWQSSFGSQSFEQLAHKDARLSGQLIGQEKLILWFQGTRQIVLEESADPTGNLVVDVHGLRARPEEPSHSAESVGPEFLARTKLEHDFRQRMVHEVVILGRSVDEDELLDIY